MKNFKITISILLLAVITGCVTSNKMGITKKTSVLELKEKSLLLLTVELKNNYCPNFQPYALVVFVETPDADSKSERLSFIVDKEGTVESGLGNKYMIRMMIDHGEYIIRGISGCGGICPYQGIFYMPLHSSIKVESGEIVYLGKVKGSVRKREKNEFRAGPVIPLLAQALAGFLEGTFDVEVVDASQEDISKFKAMYPFLADKDFKVKILPPFDRKVAQEFWEKKWYTQ